MGKLIIILSLLNTITFAKNNTPDFYKCTGRVGGEWNFGRAPDGCNASSFGEDQFIVDNYSDMVFRDNSSERTAERNRYMDDLHATLRDAADYYIKKRKPNVSQSEIDAWKLGVMAMANQESYWSHYRKASDNKIKMMRGDFGHGHGLLQVDDRYHYPAVQNGIAWSLIGNMAYSFDEFYTAWERAPNVSCVKGPTDFTARIRSAWAAYNGGPSKICRWTNPKDTWARNDIGFNQKLSAKSWQRQIQNPNKTSTVNVECLMENRENCLPPSDNIPKLGDKILYQSNSGVPCVLGSRGLSCLRESKDALCLRAVSAFTNSQPEIVADETFARYPQQFLDRHSTCSAFDPTLVPVGKMIQLNTTINLRASAGGGLLDVAHKGEVAEVLDFEIRNLGSNHRYYKISIDGKIGFIYGGQQSDYINWAQESALKSPLPSVIARVDESINIVNPAGINLRESAGGIFVRNIPARTILVVQEYLIKGSENSIYYKVSFGGKSGYIYSGHLLPSDSTSLWTKRVK